MSNEALLSDPPVRVPSAASNSHIIYKGVMLSMRPPTGLAAQPGRKPPFVSGGHLSERVGYPPVRRPGAFLRKKRITVTPPAIKKHRKWLDDLKNERQQYTEHRLAEQAQQDERMRNFKERAAFVRRRICEAAKGSASALTEREASMLFSAPLWKLRKDAEEKARASSQSRKPAWSMTEEEGAAAQRQQIQELIDFAASLDISKYLADVEIQDLVRSVKDRVTLLAGHDFSADTEAAKSRRQAIQDGQPDQSPIGPIDHLIQHRENDNEPDGGDVDDDGDEASDEAISKLINESRVDVPSIRTVHSKSSFRQAMESASSKAGGNTSPSFVTTTTTTEPRDITYEELPRPQIVDIDAGAIGRTQQEKVGTHVSMLPYLHRNPAV
ncbi:unnamed protein product (mitochondrion) [Plasmodiophora brassicae]|uniref:Uncharacterized protein n=2 Tax=Plasmodiophora brassicae TaxID=37360 RepID=A0A3P3YAQ0_PLABS|nr:unnamed protein product [Plasmodiophora brassicae]